MNFESGIAIFWLLPVVVQIVLPLIMLLFYGVGKLFPVSLTSTHLIKKSDTIHNIQGKSGLPPPGAMA